MRILVLGGTSFVGRHMVEKALALGHEVAVFHRGKTGADLFEGVEHILGDRDGGLGALGAGKWDWAIDTSGYVPRIVRQSCEALKCRAAKYLFISTLSVYADRGEGGADENSPLKTLDDPTVEVIDGETYGGLKVLCEQEASLVFGSDAIIVRPGMIVGPYDSTDRFTYWFLRASKGGKMISLCERDEPVQFIDARDLADFCLHLLGMGASGIFNATGPQFPMTWGDIFDEAALQAGTTYEIVRPPLDWLQGHGVESLPAQFPRETSSAGVYLTSIKKSIGAGLKFLPLATTVRDTVAWRKTVSEPLKVGMEEDKERELLQAYG